ncbi:MAG: NH(3)-dependent NAD(+) synthetase [Candidatus Uhrbacteria bacterium GW2011_GWC2_41_11]|uniref:NH(3)-dependent NAD(+) synthetase n=1 Tax=Candidatus Uhrbacteria bacterium GW2011_GWC2_41_11 TaxID=1618985 RepID=A0A0G0WPA6_9BACT|nr:MAG: NH(3)-dependent NAD(+) synthetase [Candidatus Uhrbacteria bacterium GW2011_GWC2_41_11]
MKVVIPQAVVGHIGSWLRERLTVNGKILTAVVGLSGGIDSGLVALICKYHGIPLVCVNMPCHSSAWSMIRAKNLADEYGLKFMIVETTKAADLIRSQVEAGLDIEEDDISRNDLAGLYSTSRSPVLDFVAKTVRYRDDEDSSIVKGGMIVGTGNRDEDGIVRYFAKRGDGAVDLSPIADLHKSEVCQVFEWLATRLANMNGRMTIYPFAQAILNAKPSADLWGGQEQYDEDELGCTYAEVEWVDEFVTDLIPSFFRRSSEQKENWIADWVRKGMVTEDQVDLIRKITAIEKSTRHKENPDIPVCRVHTAFMNEPWFE